jgi:hypothetical protein
VREIGARLGVAALLEGSVRREANRVRVSAQLVSSEDEFHLWSESYDRALDGIFAIQQTLRPRRPGRCEGLKKPAHQRQQGHAVHHRWQSQMAALQSRGSCSAQFPLK